MISNEISIAANEFHRKNRFFVFRPISTSHELCPDVSRRVPTCVPTGGYFVPTCPDVSRRVPTRVPTWFGLCPDTFLVKIKFSIFT